MTEIANNLRLRKVAELLPYARNAKTHSDTQVAEIAASIVEFGYTNPVLADSKGIVAGHGRVLGAGVLYAAGKTIYLPNGEALPFGTVPVLDCEGWSASKRKAYILADNKLAENSGWDTAMLKTELADLKEEGYDLSLIGFSETELADLFTEEQEPVRDPDKVPPTPIEPHSKPGDVWICGPHRVMCGDSLSITDWDMLMEGAKADMAWTDPPYNVAYDGGTKVWEGIKNDDMSDKQFHDFLLGAYTSLFTVMKPGAAIYVAHPDREAHQFHNAFREAGFKFSGCVIWKKNSLVMGRSDYQSIHEPILYGWKPGAAHRWFGGRKQTSIRDLGEGSPFEQQPDGRWLVQVGDQTMVISGDAMVERLESSVIFHDKPGRSKDHPTTKPVGLITKMLKNNARHNDIVVDAFGGSGSTMIAAEMMGMCGRLMELDPKFVDVQCRRYFEFTGRHAINAETGEKFPAEALA